jgi:oligopeptide/dipeptide ABC transporter ATP-binding protein
MYLGRAVEVAASASFFAAPSHPYAAALVAAAALDAGVAHSAVVSGDPPSVTDPPPGCRFHPRCWLYRSLGEPERCRADEPRLEPAGPGVISACHFREREGRPEGLRVAGRASEAGDIPAPTGTTGTASAT